MSFFIKMKLLHNFEKNLINRGFKILSFFLFLWRDSLSDRLSIHLYLPLRSFNCLFQNSLKIHANCVKYTYRIFLQVIYLLCCQKIFFLLFVFHAFGIASSPWPPYSDNLSYTLPLKYSVYLFLVSSCNRRVVFRPQPSTLLFAG